MQTSTVANRRDVATSGRIEGLSVAALFWALHCQRVNGVLSIEHDGISKRIYFEEGEVVFALSGDFDDRLGEYFLRTDRLTFEDLRAILPDLDGTQRIGELLVERGLISSEDLKEGVRTQIFEFLLDVFLWDSGSWSLEEGPLPSREEIRLDRPMWDLILEAFQRERSFLRLRRMVGPLGIWLQLVAPLEPGAFGEEMRPLIEALAEGPQTLADLLDVVYISNFEACQRLAALRTIGVVEEVELSLTLDDPSREGTLGACGLGPILVELCRDAGTGVLQLVQGSRERSFHLREGCLVFATSNDIEDGLLAFLLRRGVISLRDREEVARRLLTNKRIGTILQEIDAISGEDLDQMVREQLREIVEDSLTWETGKFAFRSGELPTHEPIILEQSLEQLISDAYHRVNSWSKLERGSGGFDRIVQLAPDYEAILDRMEIGPEEWEILTLLRQPTNGRSICRKTEIGVFRVAKVLWSLWTLGAVEHVSDDVAERVMAEEAALAEMGHKEFGNATITVPRPALEEALADETVADEPWRVEVTTVEDSEPTTEEEENLSGIQTQEEDVEPDEAGSGLGSEIPSSWGSSSGWKETPTAAEAEDEPLDDSLLEALEACDENSGDRYIEVLDRNAIKGLSRNIEHPEGGDDTIEGALLDDFEEPETLAEAIDRLNDRQRVMFRAIRAEIGAGAVNFVRSCAENIVVDAGAPFEAAELESDGSWNRETLREAVVRQRIDDPEAAYRQVIEDQVEMLRLQIGDRRAEKLATKLGL